MLLLSSVKSSSKDVVLLVFTVVTVTLLVPLTVKTVRVTYRMERVSRVNLDGMEYFVVQNVKKVGMVSAVVSSAQDIVETGRPVIT